MSFLPRHHILVLESHHISYFGCVAYVEVPRDRQAFQIRNHRANVDFREDPPRGTGQDPHNTSDEDLELSVIAKVDSVKERRRKEKKRIN